MQSDVHQTTKTYKGTIDELLRHRNEIPAEAQVELKVWQAEPEIAEELTPSPNAGMLEALFEIAGRQKGCRHTDGSQTERILREGRSGAMWGCDPK